MERGKDYKRLIQSSEWRRLRAAVLTAHPLCRRCEADGLITAASEVHHIRPVDYGISLSDKRRLMFSPLNLMPLCHACHVAVHNEMGRSGRKAQQRRNDEQVKDVVREFFGE